MLRILLCFKVPLLNNLALSLLNDRERIVSLELMVWQERVRLFIKRNCSTPLRHKLENNPVAAATPLFKVELPLQFYNGELSGISRRSLLLNLNFKSR